METEFSRYIDKWSEVATRFLAGGAAPEDTSSLPYQFEPVEFSDKDRKRLNISDSDRFYRIVKDGRKVSGDIFGKGAFTASVGDLNTKRFVRLFLCVEDRYGDDIVKECGLKSPFFLRRAECVFDMESGEVAFVSKERVMPHFTVAGNLCVDCDGKGVYHLPSREYVLRDENWSFNYIETKMHVYVYVNKWDKDKCAVYRVSKESGAVADCDKI